MTRHDPRRWERMEEIFNAAIDCEPTDRDTFVCRACADDSQLLSELQRMLDIEPSADAIMEKMSPGRQYRVEFSGDEQTHIPDQIGRYKVQRLVAAGGMGTVYETTQENPHRSVAVKLMHSGLASSKAKRRFEFESELLARLSHPGIAQVYEAGMFRDGRRTRPYFAMEYVAESRTITQFAVQNEFNIRKRLELFAIVCDAVEHGHQRGIIHRDLKPGNILVDHEGRPRIIDFGIARVTNADIDITTMQTEIGQLIGTLQYMSPEQCIGDSLAIDIRSDVYSLGVVLYELLCDQLPYDVADRTLGEATHIVREKMPPRLSTFDARLRGEVETIVQKTLQKEKEHRYSSAAELASDIRRYLAGEAILARPPSVAYQLRVLFRRNKILFGGIASVFAVLILAVTISSSLYLKAIRAENRANKERDAALAFSEFLTRTLSFPDPYLSQGPNATVRGMLDAAARRIEDGKELADQPLVEATLCSAIGRTYDNLSLHSEAERHLTRSLKIRRRELGGKHPLVAESLHDLARALRWYGEGDGKDVMIESMFRDSLAMRLKLLGEADPATMESMHSLAEWLRDIGKFGESEELFYRLLPLRQKHFGNEHLEIAQTEASLGELLWWKEEYATAEPLLRRALEMRRSLLGDEHALVASSLRSLGLLRSDRGDLDEAEELLRTAVAIEQKTLGGEHGYANSSSALGRVLRDKDKLNEAEKLLRKFLEKQIDLLDDDSPRIAYARSDLGDCLVKMKRFSEAEAELLEAQRILKDRLAPESHYLRSLTKRLVSLYGIRGRRWNIGGPS